MILSRGEGGRNQISWYFLQYIANIFDILLIEKCSFKVIVYIVETIKNNQIKIIYRFLEQLTPSLVASLQIALSLNFSQGLNGSPLKDERSIQSYMIYYFRLRRSLFKFLLIITSVICSKKSSLIHSPLFKQSQQFLQNDQKGQYIISLTAIKMSQSSKESTLLAFHRKVKSPYTLQYLQFQERLKGKKPKPRLPLLAANIPRKTSETQTENYLELAHDILSNKSKFIFGEDKENFYPTIDSNDEILTNLREKIGRMKTKTQHQHMHPRPNHNPHNHAVTNPSVSPINPEPKSQSQSGLRSRVRSQAGRQSQAKQNSLVTFLQYKKSKRDFSTKINRDRQSPRASHYGAIPHQFSLK